MDMGEFADWLSEMVRLSGEQIALALTELGEVARRSNDGGSSPETRAKETEAIEGADDGRLRGLSGTRWRRSAKARSSGLAARIATSLYKKRYCAHL